MIGSLLCLAATTAGCHRLVHPAAIDNVPGLSPWDADTYAAFVGQNIEELNRHYSEQYAPVEFVVDTAAGSVRIQTLIEPTATALLAEVIAETASDDGRKIGAILEVIRQRFAYVPEPQSWAPVAQTIQAGRGDCKNLSLLLMSALTAAGVQAYAGISNGHMWVRAYDGNRWQLLETDMDPEPERIRIYRMDGFYEAPLYKIYADRSLKRIRKR